MSLTQNRSTIPRTAQKWRDDRHSPRQEAVNETLQAPNRWTEAALNHTLDRWMQQLTSESLKRWIGSGSGNEDPPTVAVLHGADEPLAGFRAAIGTWALGYSYVGVLPEASPSLLSAFAGDLSEKGGKTITFASAEDALSRADAVVADPGGAVEAPADACDREGIPERRRLLHPETFSVGVVDGNESDEEMDRFAEDMLLFEGGGHRRLAVLWAPDEHPPDAYLEAMARFRGFFPAHDDTPGALQMQQAFLEARDESHAYADGLEFLVSRGDPTPQKAGHVRWSEYGDLDAVHRWWKDHRDEVYAVIARRGLHDRCPTNWPLRTPGGVHVPPLDDAEGERTMSFLKSLSG